MHQDFLTEITISSIFQDEPAKPAEEKKADAPAEPAPAAPAAAPEVTASA